MYTWPAGLHVCMYVCMNVRNVYMHVCKNVCKYTHIITYVRTLRWRPTLSRWITELSGVGVESGK